MTAPDRGAVGDGELQFAIRLADHVLDQNGRDPDDDLSVLARQFGRSRETVARLSARVEELEAALREIDGQAEARIVAWLREQAAAGRALAKRPISGNAAIAYDSAAARLMRAATQITRGEHREAGDRG